MRVILLMAGEGKRFKDAGFKEVKPLIPFRDRPLVEYTLDMLRGLGEIRLECICRSEAIAQDLMTKVRWPKACWHIFQELTKGPLLSALKAIECLDVEEEVLVADCDSFMGSDELRRALELFHVTNAVGGVTIRKTQDEAVSYARVSPAYWVEETAERDRIGEWSPTGPYWFSSGRRFLAAAQKAAKMGVTTISPVYNHVGGKVKAVPVSSFCHIGDPDAYQKHMKAFVPQADKNA